MDDVLDSASGGKVNGTAWRRLAAMPARIMEAYDDRRKSWQGWPDTTFKRPTNWIPQLSVLPLVCICIAVLLPRPLETAQVLTTLDRVGIRPPPPSSAVAPFYG
jgi:hypothetical protein